MSASHERRSTSRRATTTLVVLAASVLGACSPKVAHLTNARASRCQDSLRDAFAIMLFKQNEKADVAELVGAAGAKALADADLGPKPFKISSTSGWDYAMFFDDEMGRCLVHLVAMQKGPVQYSNNVTFLDTRSLPGCKCVE